MDDDDDDDDDDEEVDDDDDDTEDTVSPDAFASTFDSVVIPPSFRCRSSRNCVVSTRPFLNVMSRPEYTKEQSSHFASSCSAWLRVSILCCTLSLVLGQTDDMCMLAVGDFNMIKVIVASIDATLSSREMFLDTSLVPA